MPRHHDNRTLRPRPPSQGRSNQAPSLEARIDALIAMYERKSRRLYRITLALRVLVAAATFAALLPDSSLFTLSHYSHVYGAITTIARIVAALLVLAMANLRLRESLATLHDFVAFLCEKRLALVSMDTLSREIAEVDLRRELDARQATLHRGVLDGLETLIQRMSN
jgi:hypothetical protein